VSWRIPRNGEVVRYIADDTDRGTTQVKSLEENMGALDVKLLEVEVAEIRNVVDAAEVHGQGIRMDSQRRHIELVQL
jgi:hypothetical protein